MKIFNQNKTQEISDYDLTLGKLVPDKLTVHYDETKAVKEVGHYETIREYENGGKDVKWVVDVKGVKYQPATFFSNNSFFAIKRNFLRNFAS